MMQRYESYKASGVEWLGEIPEHWKLQRTKYLFSERVEKGFPKEDLLAATQRQGVVRKTDYDARTVEATKDFHLLKLVKKGDFVISLRSFEGGIEFAYHRGIISPAYTVMKPEQNIDSGFFRFFFKSIPFIQGLNLFVTGIREGQNIDYTKLRRAFLPIPPQDEQKRIADFLDQKTAEIEAAIAKKQRLIELLQEQKSILINQAVTRGLNPNVPMRESGVEWIGEIPAHWEIIPNRYLFREQNTRSLKGEETHLSMSQRYGLIPAKELDSQTLQSESYDGAKLCKTGDLVQNRLKAHLAVFAVAPCDGLVSPDYSVFRLQNRENSPIFFERLFKTPIYLSEFNRRVRGIVVGFLRLYSDDFNAIPALVPPQEEQLSIVEYINQLNADFGTMQEKIETEIGLLTEFKTIVIASAVTGKIKVL